MLAPVGVVSSSFTLLPDISIFDLSNISKIAPAGFDTVPCENVTVPLPTETGVVIISSSKHLKSSSAIAVPTMSITVSMLEAS